MHPTFEWTVHARDTDYSGFLYTPAVIDCMCRAMESFMADVGLSMTEHVVTEERIAPVVHAEADYLAGLYVEDVVDVTLTPEVGDTSVTYRAVGRRDGEEVFRGHLVMAFTDRSRNSIPVPGEIATVLAEYADP